MIRRRSVLPRFLRTFLAWRWMPVAVALIAGALALPSLWSGFRHDDHNHRYMFLTENRPALGLFTLLPGDPEHTEQLMDIGALPWWTVTELRIAFLRPLGSATHWFDYRVWPDSAMLMHAHSLLWFVAAVAAVGVLYRRILGPTWIAGLAALLFAFDDAHATPAAWLANRYALPAILFGVLAIIAYDRWRTAGWRKGAILGPAAFGVSLLFAEAGISTLAYLLAYAVFVDRGSLAKRLVSLAPYVGIACVWQVAYVLLDMGTWGSGFYTSPIAEPVRFVAGGFERALTLLLAQWALPPMSGAHLLLYDKIKLPLLVVAVLVVSFIAVVLAPLIRRDRVARFWATGMLLSLVPLCATVPMDRLLLFVGVGAFGLIAQFLGAVFGPRNALISGRPWRFVVVTTAACMLFIHGFVAPVLMGVRCRNGGALARQAPIQEHIDLPDDESLSDKTVVIVNPLAVLRVGHLLVTRHLDGKSVPRLRILSASFAGAEVRRVDQHTLRVRPDGGYLLNPIDQLYRGVHHRIGEDEAIELTGMTVKVTDVTDDGRPAEATFRFDRPLEDDSLLWFCWKGRRYERFDLPTVGSSVRLPRPSLSSR